MKPNDFQKRKKRFNVKIRPLSSRPAKTLVRPHFEIYGQLETTKVGFDFSVKFLKT